MVVEKTETAREKAVRRWHVHPETGIPHGADICSELECTIESVTTPEKYLLTQGTVWKVSGFDGEEFIGKLRSIAKGVLRFDTKDGSVVEVPAVQAELKSSTAKIA